MTAEEKLLGKRLIDDETGCWLWTGKTNGRGYGVTSHGTPRTDVYVHRLAYETWVEPIPDGLHVDHLCSVRNCLNPEHLEAVSVAENNRRSRRPGSHKRRTAPTECRRGHPYDERNTYWTASGTRKCRTCHAIQERRRRGEAKQRSRNERGQFTWA
jgi:hypothetical protein